VTIYRQADLRPGLLARPVLTIGNFDGVHLGHRRVLARAIEEARARGTRGVAFTFEPHPVKVLNPGRDLRLIHPYAEKARVLESTGIDDIVIWTFDRALAAMPAEEFVRTVLVELLDTQKIVVGYDFNFGRGGDGNAQHLREIAERMGYGYEVERVGVFQIDGEIVSSSRIRSHLLAGEVARVARLLGRPFHLRGTVVRGAGRGGKDLGFPTANLSVQQELIPRDGVYLGQVRIGAGLRDALVNVGDNPTFGINPVTVESFLLDFDGAIYESAIDVLFLDRLRDEVRFAGPEPLRVQMEKDLARAREFFRAFHART
jgi:riboflavin kinase/FMN adenylyltransferase